MEVEARLTLARLYAGNNQGGKAEQAYREAVRRFPKHAEIREEFALLLARERKYEEAQSTIRLISPPLNPEARVRYYRLRASIDSGLGDVHAAAHAMEQALRSAPSDDALQYLTALTEAEAGDWESCLRNVKNLNARNPTVDSGLLLLLRAQLAKREDFRSALQSLRALHVAEDQRLHVKVRSSELLAAANQHADAAEELEAAAKLAGGDDPALLFNLAVEQYSSGQFALALATIQSLRALNDSAELEDLAGDTQEQTGDRESAVRSHQNAIALAPKEERYRLSLGSEVRRL
jgi:predicted Zn-dependent protease